MANYKMMTPDGMRDYIYDEVLIRHEISRRLTKTFKQSGYSEVITPGLEYLDVFLTKGRGTKVEDMFKLVDSHGRLMVVRPDTTTPIARIAATRLKDESLPLRLFYHQTIYLNSEKLKGYNSESMQSGIELIAPSSLQSDLEILFLAITTLNELEVKNFRLEIGHIGIFNCLIEQLDLDENQKENIRLSIETKNYPELDLLLEPFEKNKVVEVIRKLPRLFGEDVFEEILSLTDDSKVIQIVLYLKKIYEILKLIDVKGQISIDFGIVNRNDYYTGIVFKGYLEDYLAQPVLIGGRYDQMLASFKRATDAIGFAIDVDIASKVFDKSRLKPEENSILIIVESGYEAKGYMYCKQLKQPFEYALTSDLDKAKALAKQKGIYNIALIGEQIKHLKLKEEE